MAEQRLVITISHQLGSGGGYLGQKLAERLGIPFIDREILKKVSDQLHMAEGALAHREERLTSFWQSLTRIAAFTDPAECLSVDSYEPSDKELFQLESQMMGRIAKESGAVFLGRCGWHILRGHPGHFSVLVLAERPERVKRVRQLFCLSAEEAGKLIDANDRERAAYIRAFTRHDWLDPRLYDLCLNTSKVGLDRAVDLVLACVSAAPAAAAQQQEAIVQQG